MEIAEYVGGVLQHRYVPGHSVDQRVAWINVGAGSTHYYHANRQGSVQAVVNTSGVVTDQYVYTPFGVEEPLNTTGNPFRYTGRRYDSESDLFYYRARYYDAGMGRFLQTDPIGYEDQMNLYAYVHNDPLTNTDPSGEFCVPCVVAGAVLGVVVDVAGQAVENGGFKDIDVGQAARAGAIGATGAGALNVGRTFINQASQAGVRTGVVSAINSARNVLIGATTATAEAINSGATGTEVLSTAAVDMATAKIGGAVISEIEGGDKIAGEVGEQVSNAAGDVARGAKGEQGPKGLEVNISRGNGNCTPDNPC